jgi:hypothetical protein
VSKAFVILALLLLPAVSMAAECRDDSSLTVTAPRSGARTFNTSISFRGFTCDTARVVLVHNITTNEDFMADTDELCDESSCIYRFATFVYNLAVGVNELRVTIPGREDASPKTVQVVRTALVWNEFFQPADLSAVF